MRCSASSAPLAPSWAQAAPTAAHIDSNQRAAKRREPREGGERAAETMAMATTTGDDASSVACFATKHRILPLLEVSFLYPRCSTMSVWQREAKAKPSVRLLLRDTILGLFGELFKVMNLISGRNLAFGWWLPAPCPHTCPDRDCRNGAGLLRRQCRASLGG